MEKDTKGLTDNGNGDFILNESGTSISADLAEGIETPPLPKEPEQQKEAPVQQNPST